MRTRLAAIGGIATAVTIAMLGSPVAQADDDSFVQSVRSAGFVQTRPNLILIARSACSMLSYNNRIPAEIEARIQRYTRVQPDKAHQFFVLAIDEYCPGYSWATGA